MVKFTFVFLAVFHQISLAAADSVILHERFFSPSLGVDKAFRLYLPDGYNENNKRYPVIYLIHGAGVTENLWADTPDLDVGSIADALDLKAIVVMPDGDRSYYANAVAPVDYKTCLEKKMPPRNAREPRADFCVRRANYSDYITTDLVRHIDRTYRTVPSAEARAITGESMGGFGALQLAFRHPEIFSSVASHSGPVSLRYYGPYPYQSGNENLQAQILPMPDNPGRQEHIEIFGTNVDNWKAHEPLMLAENVKSGELAIYFDCGEQDEYGFYNHARLFHDRLTDLHIEHRFETGPGGHDDVFFGSRIDDSLQFHVEHFQNRKVYETF